MSLETKSQCELEAITNDQAVPSPVRTMAALELSLSIQRDIIEQQEGTIKALQRHNELMKSQREMAEDRARLGWEISQDLYESIWNWRQGLSSSDPVGKVIDSLLVPYVIRKDDCEELPEIVVVEEDDDQTTFTFPTFEPGQYVSSSTESLTRFY